MNNWDSYETMKEHITTYGNPFYREDNEGHTPDFDNMVRIDIKEDNIEAILAECLVDRKGVYTPLKDGALYVSYPPNNALYPRGATFLYTSEEAAEMLIFNDD